MDRSDYNLDGPSTSDSLYANAQKLFMFLQGDYFYNERMVPEEWDVSCCRGKTVEKEISLAEVAKHDSVEDCWVILFNSVYDLTPFLSMHPGGMEILLESAGRDATFAYQEVGHNKEGLNFLSHLRIGVLPDSERLPQLW